MSCQHRSKLLAALGLCGLVAGIDVRNSVRRSVLGPLWGSVGLLVATALLGLLFGTVFKRDLTGYDVYVSRLGAGLIVWHYLSKMAIDSCAMVIRWLPNFRHSGLPLLVLPFSAMARHTAMLVLNLTLFIAIQAVVVGVLPSPAALAAALVLIIATAAWLATLLALLSARFRDIGQLVSGAFQLGFILTPIVWPSHFLGRFEYLLDFNPLHYLVTALRDPLLGNGVEAHIWLGLSVSAVIGAAIAAASTLYARRRLPYWI